MAADSQQVGSEARPICAGKIPRRHLLTVVKLVVRHQVAIQGHRDRLTNRLDTGPALKLIGKRFRNWCYEVGFATTTRLLLECFELATSVFGKALVFKSVQEVSADALGPFGMIVFNGQHEVATTHQDLISN